MAIQPFLIAMRVTLSANGTGTLTFQASSNEMYKINGIVYSSTGSFDITGMNIDGGVTITNARTNSAIPSTHIPSSANNNNSIDNFLGELTLNKNQTLNIDLLDTSGAGNTVVFTLQAQREY